MSHFFINHPKVSYDLNKNNRPVDVQNPLVRFIYKEALKDKATSLLKLCAELNTKLF